MSLLGIDIGTSGVRAAAYDIGGELLSSHATATALSRPADGFVETDAEGVLVAVESVVRTVTATRAVLEDPVQAVSFSVQGEAVVPVDSRGSALAAAPVSMDRRGAGAASALGDRLGRARVQAITGQPLHPMFSIHKIAVAGDGWADPAVAGYRCLDGFVAARFGARNAIDWSMAARTGAFDVGARTWSSEILDATRAFAGSPVDEQMLPEPVMPGTVIGLVSPAAASRTGLAEGTPIVAGLHDQAASFIGAGGHAGAIAVFALGSSDCLTVATTTRPDVADTGFASYPISPDCWITLAGTAAGGWALEWFAGLTGTELADVFDRPAAQPPALIVLPYFTGSGTLDNDPSARGVIVGLTLETTRADLGRAFLESTGYELAKIIDAFAAVGVTVPPIHAVGGGSSNRTALAIRADAAGLPLSPSPGFTSARGAALVAGAGTDVYDGLDGLPAAPVEAPAEPDPETRHWYDSQRTAFRALYEVTRPINDVLSAHKENP